MRAVCNLTETANEQGYLRRGGQSGAGLIFSVKSGRRIWLISRGRGEIDE
jgi:hypothetical protein